MIQPVPARIASVASVVTVLLSVAAPCAGDDFDPATLKRFTAGVPYREKYETGLYPGGKNEMPDAHRRAGERIAATIRPLDTSGKPDDATGRILALALGHSNCRMYFEAFQKRLGAQAADLQPKFELLNAGMDGQQLPQIARLEGPVWDAARKLTDRDGYSSRQVQVLFLHTTYHPFRNRDRTPPGEFPQTMQAMQRDLAKVLAHCATVYPNLKIAYVTCDGFRHFTGFEPHVWQEAFAFKWLIESQIKQEAGVKFEDEGRRLPFLVWGPYIWDNTWDESYFSDGVHPTPKALQIFVEKYWQHLRDDSIAKPWFLKPAHTATSPDTLLLKDFRPSSIYKIPRTRVDKARFPVIDVHSHPYAKTPAQVEQWVRNMDEVGIQRTVVMVSASGKAFDDAVALYMNHLDRFEMWCGLGLSGTDQTGFAGRAIAELERCQRLGARGVGELVDKGRGLGFAGNRSAPPMHIDDPRMDPILDRCAALGLPVNIHVGEDRWMYEPMDATNDGLMNSSKWRVPNEPGVLRHDEVVATLERAVKKHPRTTFIACHFANCCSDLSILGRMFDATPNLFADIGARFGETAPIPRYMARFFERYQDRLLYGTDMGFNPEMYRTTFRILETEDEHFYATDLFGYHWPLHGFGLKDRVLRKVYAVNAKKILRTDRSGKDR